MNKIVITSLMLALLVICKPSESLPEQIQGVRYASYTQWIYKTPGTTKKEDQVALVYGFEEVTALGAETIEVEEGKTKKSVDYLKVKTVDQKEGYAAASGFAEGIFFVSAPGLDAFLKPTFTAGTKGKVSRGSYCLMKETIGEFSKVDCKETILQPDSLKLEDLYNVWITASPEYVNNDPLLGETTKLLRQASTDYIKLKDIAPEEAEKLKKSILASLEKAEEKEDLFFDDVRALKQRFEASMYWNQNQNQ
ncbi:lipoprotein LenA [Leptospira sp. GIMC2001]|uniref:lipoprotein LenA n=1 Tax=Leptospira sp. GIMC2001 TaxID=1513297 RepID=UPI002349C4BE|nr:lipoprotein LenA [Leptospira sp. GIMC2001]WCL49028.1 lipoprotein LenA [Leptospira sp. GIMC2001]